MARLIEVLVDGRTLKLALYGYCAAAAVYMVLQLTPAHGYQWDLPTYYFAPIAFFGGRDPYDGRVLQDVAGGAFIQPWTYPPVALWVFRPLSLISYTSAYYVFLGVKLVAIAALLILWRRRFLADVPCFLFIPFCMFAFNATLYADLRAGNIAVFESLLLWTAFAAFARSRYLLAGLLLAAAAIFKITPFLFVALLALTSRPDARRAFWTIVALGAVAAASTYFLSPALSASFAAAALARTSDAGGLINPNTVGLISAAVARLPRLPDHPEPLVQVVWGLCAVTIGAVSWRAALRFKTLGGEEAQREIVFLACLAYALVMPRFKDYSYVLLLAPAYAAFAKAESIRALVPFVLLAGVFATPVPGFGAIRSYFPLWLAAGAWWLDVNRAFSLADGPPTGRAVARA